MHVRPRRLPQQRSHTSAVPASKTAAYRPDIDGLRAIAVVLVMGFHAFPTTFTGGFIGVDIFFVLSGFLITALITVRLRAGSFSLRDFYGRRIRRIFPALVLVMVSVYLCGWLLLLKDEYRTLASQIVASAIFSVNVVFWLQTGYFDIAGETKPLLHLWSLAVEEQFYLLYPLLLWAGWVFKCRSGRAILLLAVFSFLLNVYQVRYDAAAAFYLPHTRFWEFLLGALAVWTRRDATPERSANPDSACDWQARSGSQPGRLNASVVGTVQSVAGSLLLALSVLAINRNMDYPGWWALLPAVGSYLLIQAGAYAWVNRWVLSDRRLVGLGLLSYPLYLWHWPLLSFARITDYEPPSLPLRILLLATAIVLAWATYRWVEMPLRFGAHGRRKLVGLALAMICVGTLGAMTFFKGSLPPPFLTGTMRDNYAAFDFPRVQFRTSQCPVSDRLPLTSFCMATSDHPSVALIGDSHAHAIYHFVTRYEGRKQRGLLFLGSPGCVPLLGVERDAKGCSAVIDRVLDIVNTDPRIVQVLVTARFAPAESGRAFGVAAGKDLYKLSLRDDPTEPDRQKIFRIGFEHLIESLQAHGKNITVILDAPELDFDPKACLRGRGLENCAMPREEITQKQKAYTEIIRSIQARHVFSIVDLKSVLCDADVCPVVNAGQFLYRDAHHLSRYANDLLLEKNFSLE